MCKIFNYQSSKKIMVKMWIKSFLNLLMKNCWIAKKNTNNWRQWNKGESKLSPLRFQPMSCLWTQIFLMQTHSIKFTKFRLKSNRQKIFREQIPIWRINFKTQGMALRWELTLFRAQTFGISVLTPRVLMVNRVMMTMKKQTGLISKLKKKMAMRNSDKNKMVSKAQNVA